MELTTAELKAEIYSGDFRTYQYSVGDIPKRQAQVDSLEFEKYLKHTIFRINGSDKKFNESFTHKYSTRFNLSEARNIKQGVKYLQFEAPMFYKDDKRIATITLYK